MKVDYPEKPIKVAVRVAATLLAVFMLVFAYACTKDGDNAGSTTAKTSQSATAVKTTAKAATATATAGKATGTAASSAASESKAGAGETVGTEVAENTDNTEIDNSDIYEQYKEGQEEIGKVVKENFAESSIDLGGITVVHGLWGASSLLMTDSPESNPLYVIVARRIKAAEEKYNFKFEFKQINSSTTYNNEVKTSALAGLAFSDIVRLEAIIGFPVYPEYNFIIPLDDIIDFNHPLMKANSYLNVATWKGKHYGITFQSMVAYPTVMYNQEIMEREGQPDLLTLTENRQWTWETFLNVALACTRDINGDGITDQWGVISPAAHTFTQKVMYSNGVTGIEFVNNKVVYALNSPRAVKALQFMADLAHVHRVFKVTGGTMPYRLGQAAMLIDNPWQNRAILGLGLRSYMVPFPMGPDADNYSNVTGQAYFEAISAFSPKREEIAKIFADVYLVWDENLNPIPEYQEIITAQHKEDWDWNPANPLRTASFQREYEISYKALWPLFQPDYLPGYPNMSTRLNVLIYNPISKGEMSVAQAIAAAESEVQALLDEFN